MSSEATPLAIEDYEAIEAAVMETARGRWFLAEYQRRHRQADTLTIVETLERIERTINRQRKVPDIDRIRLDLADMAEAIVRTKQEIFQMKVEAEEGGRFAEASNELDAIVSQTEQATETILQNAEKAQEIAWTFRENGADSGLCDQLDEHITEIYTGCSFQDLTGQRTRKVVTVLRYLESRINSMTGIWGMNDVEDVPPGETQSAEAHVEGFNDLVKVVETHPEYGTLDSSPANPFDTRPDAHLLNGPQLAGRGIDQDDVDSLMDAPNSADEFVAVRASDMRGKDEPAVDEAVLEFGSSDEDEAAPVEPETADDGIAAAEADLFAEADVFVVTTAPEPQPAPAPAAPMPLAPAPRVATVGNTALAIAPVAVAVAAPEASPALTVVTSEDPIANLSAEEKLIVFG